MVGSFGGGAGPRGGEQKEGRGSDSDYFSAAFCNSSSARGQKPDDAQKARCKPGDTLSLRQWSGRPCRSKQLLIKEVVCKSVAPVYADSVGAKVDGHHVDEEELAMADGFPNYYEMLVWLDATHGLPFRGELISW